MTAKTAKLITPDRVKMIFECYGSNPDCWPMDEKVSALSLIQNSSELRELQQEAARFDKLLLEAEASTVVASPEEDQLLKRLVSTLPAQEENANPNFVNRNPGRKKHFFDLNNSIGAIAASVAIMVITLSIVNLKPDHVSQGSPVVAQTVASSTELDSWMWTQVAGEPAEEAEEPLTMMALLELGEI